MASFTSSVMNSSHDSRKSSHDLVVSHASASHAVTLSSSVPPRSNNHVSFQRYQPHLLISNRRQISDEDAVSFFILALSLSHISDSCADLSLP